MKLRQANRMIQKNAEPIRIFFIYKVKMCKSGKGMKE